MENTEQNNKLIAEFMGITRLNLGDNVSIFNEPNLKYYRLTNYKNDGLCSWCGNNVSHGRNVKCYTFDCDKIKYHSSWDWLMPIVEKIEQVHGGVPQELLSVSLYSEHREVYNAVVEFIKWYNENKL